MQAFTDLVGTSAVPAHAFDIAELTELTPALETAQATHGTSVEATEALSQFCGPATSSFGCIGCPACALGSPAAERPTEINP